MLCNNGVSMGCAEIGISSPELEPELKHPIPEDCFESHPRSQRLRYNAELITNAGSSQIISSSSCHYGVQCGHPLHDLLSPKTSKPV